MTKNHTWIYGLLREIAAYEFVVFANVRFPTYQLIYSKAYQKYEVASLCNIYTVKDTGESSHLDKNSSYGIVVETPFSNLVYSMSKMDYQKETM